jgi:molecular chaperone IbpB
MQFANTDFGWDRFAVGFGDIARTRQTLMETLSQQTKIAFPPYNIRKLNENNYVIELAAAGYSLGDFEVTVEGEQLVIKCAPEKTESADSFIHQGLTNKHWMRKFWIKEDVRVSSSTFVNGLLKIFLEHNIPEEKKPIRINIEAPKAEYHPQLLNEESDI